MPISEEDRARLEGMGESKVRTAVNGTGLATNLHVAALEWLSELDDTGRGRNEAAQVEQASAASRAADAAERAASAAERAANAAEAQARAANRALITAIVANVIAAIALVVGVISLLHSH